jgi:MoaA/NifB/PqqE/SkfB family radical SAM enzyme
MYLHQSGDVRACCQNWWLPLGNVKSDRLIDIWRGERAERLRAAMLERDYSLGCDFCDWQKNDGADGTLFFHNFDMMPLPDRHPDWPALMEFAVSNTCNLQCTMCNGEWSSSIRSQREKLPPLPKAYDDQFFEDLAEFLPHLQIAKFLGGEPFLARESLRILEMLADAGLRPDISITSNGTIWNDRVERIMAELAPHVVVSMDGFDKASYEAIRVGADFDQVCENVRRFAVAGEASWSGSSISFTLQRANWRSLPDLFLFAAELDVGAHVNTLIDPQSQSLFTMESDELAPIVASLEARDREISALKPHLTTIWHDQLERLRRHLGSVRTSAPAADFLYEIRRTHHRFAPVMVDDHVADDIERDIQSWAPDAWARLDLDREGVVVGGEDAGFGLAIDVVVATKGQPLAAVEEMLAPHGSRLAQVREDPSKWDRTFLLAGDSDELVRIAVVPRRDDDGLIRNLVVYLARSVDVGDRHVPGARSQVSEESLADSMAAWAGAARVHRLEMQGDSIVVVTSGEDELLGDLTPFLGTEGVAVLDALELRLGRKLDVSVEAEDHGVPVLFTATSDDGTLAVRSAVHFASATSRTLFVAARRQNRRGEPLSA